MGNPSNPRRVGTIPSASPTYVATSDNYLYVSDYYTGVQILDIKNPSAPFVVSTYSGRFPFVNNIAFSDDYAYLAGRVALEVINISNPTNPASVGHFITRGSSVLAVAVGNDHAYLGDEYAGLQ